MKLNKKSHEATVFQRTDCDEKDFADTGISQKAIRAAKKAEKEQAKARQIISTDTLPSTMKRLRACVHCKLILNAARWNELGKCPNCPSSGGINETTDDFQNVIGQIYPRMSWVSQYQGMSNFIPGMYAITINASEQSAW